MNIPYENYNNNAAPVQNAKPKKSAKVKLLIIILIFLILTFIVNSLLLADVIHTKYVTYQALGSFVALNEDDIEEKAPTQGNLGNYNITSKKNSFVDNKNKTYTLTVQLEFINYGKVGRSFNEAVDITAYQNDKEVKAVLSAEDASSEADVKVRNGQSANVILTYLLPEKEMDVNLDMKTVTGNNEFIYTVKLSQSATQPQSAEAATENETVTEKKE